MFKKVVDKFYTTVFADEEQTEEVPFANKRFMFYFSIITSLVVVVLIGMDIAENIAKN